MRVSCRHRDGPGTHARGRARTDGRRDGRAFPHRALDARGQAAGGGVYSRYPITHVTRIPGYKLAMVKARVRIDGVASDASVVSVHFAAPWPQPIDGWQRDFGMFPQTLADLAAQAGSAPILIGGDFNATIDMKPFRDLMTNGYPDAAEQADAARVAGYSRPDWSERGSLCDGLVRRLPTSCRRYLRIASAIDRA